MYFYRTALLFFLITATALAAEQGHKAHRQPHVHGQAQLHIVQQQSQLLIELNTPAMNIFGFEHVPNSKQQQKQVDTVLSSLHDEETAFAITGGGCMLETITVEDPFSHTLDDAEPAKAGSEHAEVTVLYTFLCKQPDSLQAIDIRLFDAFNHIEHIQAQWVLNAKQGGARFNRRDHLLKVN
ncbi:ZrgA family zinc uptake protein [Methylophaga sp. OBS4]|uniref:ZrgA family zinc uptake protein n=1 Tax=Methylophaga sp. OBS4 TaxID=2991935 RepID=UPI002257CA13|nr:DUF2796 domain-containing protein [Methylophaga sp. OBS4]MCX4186972.1 DUF2796 domain-containing protein [Methylophaga sp. OBS4]